MKYFLTLLLSSFLIIQVSGQTDTTPHLLKWDATTKRVDMKYRGKLPDSTAFDLASLKTVKAGDTLTNGGMAYTYFVKPPDKYDTVKVVMLTIDTGLNVYIGWQNGLKYEYEDWDHSTKWRNGYAIVKNKYYITHYLDAEKKKLSPNIIVWMSK